MVSSWELLTALSFFGFRGYEPQGHVRDVEGALGDPCVMGSPREGLLRPRCALTLSWEPLGFRCVRGYPAPTELGFLGIGQEAGGSRWEGVEAS